MADDGCLHIVADRASIQAAVAGLDLERARLLTRLSLFWVRRVRWVASGVVVGGWWKTVGPLRLSEWPQAMLRCMPARVTGETGASKGLAVFPCFTQRGLLLEVLIMNKAGLNRAAYSLIPQPVAR